MLAYGCAALITLFMLLPIYLILLAAFSSRAAIFDYPRPLVPTGVTLDSMVFFLTSHGVLPALLRSLLVGALTVDQIRGVEHHFAAVARELPVLGRSGDAVDGPVLKPRVDPLG